MGASRGGSLRDPRVVGSLVFALALVALHGWALAGHIAFARDPGVFADDVRQQVFPFFRYGDREPVQNDYLGDYVLAGSPIGFRGLYTAAALIGGAEVLSKVLPYLLLLATLLAVVSAAATVGSRWSAFASASLVLGASLFLGRMAGGLSRGFAFPLLALGLALLARGRLWLLLALVPLSAGFYPPVAVVLGLAAAFAALALPARDRGELADASTPKRLTLVAGAALITVAVALPPVLNLRPYGRMIAPVMVPRYPEAGPGGRYGPVDRAPFEGFVAGGARALAWSLRPGGRPFIPPIASWLAIGSDDDAHALRRRAIYGLVCGVIVLGGVSLARRRESARRILLFAAAALAAHLLSRFAAPFLFLPTRYVLYTVPLLTVVLLPAGAAEVARLLPASLRRRAQGWAGAVTALLVLGLLGSTGSTWIGLTRFVGAGDRLFAAISTLPANALVAGWPGEAIDNVPYVCHRRVLVSWELHQAFHTAYVEEMRRRMRALIDAYFAVSPDPLFRLRDEFGVTHLLVHLPHLHGSPPTYFAPFDAWVAEAIGSAHGQEFLARRLVDAGAVFNDGEHAVLDLATLGPGRALAPPVRGGSVPVPPRSGNS